MDYAPSKFVCFSDVGIEFPLFILVLRVASSPEIFLLIVAIFRRIEYTFYQKRISSLVTWTHLCGLLMGKSSFYLFVICISTISFKLKYSLSYCG